MASSIPTQAKNRLEWGTRIYFHSRQKWACTHRAFVNESKVKINCLTQAKNGLEWGTRKLFPTFANDGRMWATRDQDVPPSSGCGHQAYS